MRARRFVAGLLVLAAISVPVRGQDQTHATRGIVTRADPSAIVVARPKHRGDITLTLSPATHVDGTITVGAMVSVRYHDDHGRHVATAVSVERPH
ncbi:MAG: hypothetical protein K2Y23_16465 [Cyanobacteria bacterium]|nr:hypothetical protein [Cyanobacteriota bacterium]